MSNNIIEEFIESTPVWLKELEQMNKIANMRTCPICGCQFEKFKELLEAIKELKEKAWKYDDLCK